MKITAIDFETANPRSDSACALGLVQVENGQVTRTKYWLIRPPDFYFHPRYIDIHGITPEMVEHEPEFDAIRAEFEEFTADSTIIAHNAAFDMGVLKALYKRYDVAIPRMDYMCTVTLSRKMWTNLPNHKLNTMADFFGITFQHHNALEDSVVCAEIAIRALAETGLGNLEKLASHFKLKIHTT